MIFFSFLDDVLLMIAADPVAKVDIYFDEVSVCVSWAHDPALVSMMTLMMLVMEMVMTIPPDHSQPDDRC